MGARCAFCQRLPSRTSVSGRFRCDPCLAEVYLPGAGWKGFDPTLDELGGTNHIAVAVARSPESVPPIAGSFFGLAAAGLNVGVWVNELP